MSFNTHQNGLGGDRGDGGFTMIELIIVVAVVGILGSIVIFAMSNKAAEALQSACTTDANVVWTAQEARAVVEGTFAPDVASLVPDFIRTAPTTVHYVITTDISGTVFVASAAGGPAEPMTSQPNPCASIT
jgi:prepilin-type N-terminal cleavage/methylation domain-containing protein